MVVSSMVLLLKQLLASSLQGKGNTKKSGCDLLFLYHSIVNNRIKILPAKFKTIIGHSILYH